MGLKSTIQAVAKVAKTATEDLWTSVIFKSTASSGYNTATGAVTVSETSTTIKVLLESYTERQVDGIHIMSTDMKATFLQEDLSGSPDTNDLVTHSSKDWGVINVKSDPADATWEIQLRVNS
jgi:acyl-CoA hydrolase